LSITFPVARNAVKPPDLSEIRGGVRNMGILRYLRFRYKTQLWMQDSGAMPLSGVHIIMMVKSAQPGEVGGSTTTPYILSTITFKVVVYAPAERADTLPLPLYHVPTL
jgi:hypothetical protein